MKAVAVFAALLAAGAVQAQIRSAGGAVYIAGERFSLEQAIADATLENVGPDGFTPFLIVAIGPESRKLTVKGTKRNVREAVRRIQRAGGKFYVCARDVKGLSRKELLPGVRVERGWMSQELTHPAGNGRRTVSPALRRIRRLC